MLYGRTAELEILRALVESARGHHSGVLVIRGEPGIGKSALLDEVALRTKGVTVARVRAVESEAELGFAALHQLLGPALSRLHRLPPEQASALRTAFGMASARGGDRFLVSIGALSLIAELAEDAPVLCLVDDAQWLDQASANTLGFVARRLQAERVALLFAVRDGEPGRFDPSGLPELALGGLDVATTNELLAAQGMRVAAPVVERIVAGTGGNPLAVEEITPALSRVQLDGFESLPSHLPVRGRLQDAFIGRARELSRPAQTFLLVAAADETGAVTTTIGAAGRLGVSTEAMEEAERSRLVTVGEVSVRLRHPLVRSAIYESVSSVERRRVHGALAVIHQDGDDLERAAWHLAAATAGPDETVAASLEEAAALARARAALETACDALERSASLTAAAGTRARRTAAAAETAWLAGQIDRARRLVVTARSLSPAVEVERRLQRLQGWIEMTAGSVSSAGQILLTAARDGAKTDPNQSLQMAVAVAEMAWVQSEPDTVAMVRRFVSTLAHTDSADNDYYRHLLDGLAQYGSRDARDAFQALRSAMRLAELHDDTELLNSAGHLAFYIGDDAAAMRINARVAGRARVGGAIGQLLFALERQGAAEILAGRWALATATFDEASRLGESLGPTTIRPTTIAWKAYLAAVRGSGELTELIAITEKLASAGPLGVRRQLLDDILRWARGIRELVADQPLPAYRWLAAITSPAIVPMAAFDRCEAAARAELAGEANDSVEWSEWFAAATDVPWAHALAAYTRSVQPGSDAATHLQQALDIDGASHRPFQHARIQLALGVHMRRSRRRVDARRHLENALTSFEALGAAPWAERATQELRASGQTARARNPSTALDLTPQELQVARFVAEGLSNREVAARLFLSPRTVDYHLRKIFVKRGISSRGQLSRVALD